MKTSIATGTMLIGELASAEKSWLKESSVQTCNTHTPRNTALYTRDCSHLGLMPPGHRKGKGSTSYPLELFWIPKWGVPGSGQAVWAGSAIHNYK